MLKPVAISTHGDQIVFVIVATLTAKLLVMDLKLIGATTALASPSVSSQDLQTQRCIGLGVQTHRDTLWENSVHDAFLST
jgi:hypothetical protein